LLQASHTYDGADHEVYFRVRCDPHRSDCSVHNFNLAQPFRFESRSQSIGVGLCCHRDHSRLPAFCLLKRRLEIRARRERHDLKSLGIGFSYAERASPNRAR
jgi:hypothetical protein